MGFEVVTQKLDGSPSKGFNSDRYWTECVCPAASHSTLLTNESITPQVCEFFQDKHPRAGQKSSITAYEGEPHVSVFEFPYGKLTASLP